MVVENREPDSGVRPHRAGGGGGGGTQASDCKNHYPWVTIVTVVFTFFRVVNYLISKISPKCCYLAKKALTLLPPRFYQNACY